MMTSPVLMRSREIVIRSYTTMLLKLKVGHMLGPAVMQTPPMYSLNAFTAIDTLTSVWIICMSVEGNELEVRKKPSQGQGNAFSFSSSPPSSGDLYCDW
mmetsp:Transcript_18151/g.37799  ORF Transcript_18151/g.37799 Transcript_18151/m.37799 type:complete len:99 (-) Transcript_18151:732-1028(-)